MAYKILAEEMLTEFDDNVILNAFEDLINFKWDGFDELEKYKLQKIFEANLRNKSLFPNISTSNEFAERNEKEQLKEYLFLWGNKYLNARLPSQHEGAASKSPYDAMIYHLLSMCPGIGLNEEQTRKAHEMAMQSENLIGELLEEFINKQISPYGWIWCKGAVMVATDFYYQKPNGDELFLQIKNKFNTENSSSSKVRTGTKIQKWNRLINKRVSGSNEAQSNWPALQEIVYSQANIIPKNKSELSETEFSKFLDFVSSNNPSIIF